MKFAKNLNEFPIIRTMPEGMTVLVEKKDGTFPVLLRKLNFFQRWQFRMAVNKARRGGKDVRREDRSPEMSRVR